MIARWIRQWWFWAGVLPFLLIVVVLASVVAVLRWQGSAALDAERAAGRAEGAAGSFAELVAQAPVVDDDRQERLWTWIKTAREAHWTEMVPDVPPPVISLHARDFYLHWGRSRAQETADRASMAQAMADLARILDDGPVVCGSLGWLRHDFPHPESTASPSIIGHVRRIDLAILKSALLWYHDRLMIAPDPAIFHNLDQLVAATVGAGDLTDGIEHDFAVRERDAIYLRLVANDTLDHDRLAAWLAEGLDSPAILAKAIRAERVHDQFLIADRFYREQPWFGIPAFTAMPTMVTCDELFLDRTAATWARRYRLIADAIDDGTPLSMPGAFPDGPAWTWSERNSIIAHSISSVPNLVDTAVEADNYHRLYRAGAVLIAAWRAGNLPSDAIQARALIGPWLAATPLTVPLVYERLSPTRFRVGTDPQGPLPATLINASVVQGIRSGDLAVAPGKPASKHANIVHAWYFEMECADLPPASSAATPAAVVPAS